MKIGVIFGGCSEEHEVSLASAENVIKVLEQNGYDPLQIGLNKSGKEWYLGKSTLDYLISKADKNFLPKSLSNKVDRIRDQDIHLCPYSKVPPEELHDVDIIFPLIHGKSGEDGTIQGLCHLFQKPFIGCGLLSSTICFNKAFTKSLVKTHCIPVVNGILVKKSEYKAEFSKLLRDIRTLFGEKPLFVKPNKSGSSFGISKVFDLEGIKVALENAFYFDDEILIEELVEHREIVVGIVQKEDKLIVSVPGECKAVGDIYNYSEKYIIGNSRWECPANLTDEQLTVITELATKIFQILQCKDLARIDFFINRFSGEIYLNEINTIPGFTSSSVFPKLMEATGYSFQDLVKIWIDNNVITANIAIINHL